ncbi:cyclododecanone monooxygenase [Hyphomonas polymorpha PS728]|uniref:Cyclododecanone monooxygenase n=1 Tax=Hyphomonas polymorpha PS728 TaxID=1280954 RepID=A0A062VJZ3_9PROT|nr:NAD(P)/FAD-dependent oxidoreductase [Hyphomonas polymorpha]KCZ98873.1 cyclododecanone monooxygenase [Hyphomonas polymorpha PS728]
MADDAALDLGFDPNQLRDRYRAERDKRLRRDGNEQYVNVAGQFAHYLEDPYTERVARAPVTDHVEVAVIGGGFGGLLSAARLRKAGFKDIRMIETGGDFGGTWYWNRYPGAACDIESYIYLPLLEETGYIPKEKYAKAPEILEHSARIAKHFNLYENALLGTCVTGMEWDEDRKVWIIMTDRDHRFTAQFVIMSNGPLNRPKLPGIPGVESFKGHSFHTSRWDYQYTGGDSTGGLTKLKDKVVGIIGTGATAVQCVPHLAEGAKHLYVFQRTPSSIDVRNDRPTDVEWVKSLQPGWQRRRMENFNTLVSGGYEPEDLVQDGWTDIIRNILFIASSGDKKGLSPERLAELAELADFKKMEQVRARVDEVIKDPETAAKLKPWYRQFCKRPCFHDAYLNSFNRPNVTLVDTGGQGVERITEDSIIVDGIEYKIDCLVYATGFEVGTDYTRRAGYDPVGKGGVTMKDHWADGMRSLHGLAVNNFPNMFLMGPGQAGFTANYPHLLDEQAEQIAYILSEVSARQAGTFEASPEGEAAWVQQIVEKAVMRQQFLEECTPGYYNNEGKPSDRAAQNNSYGEGPNAYFRILKAWRDSGELEGLELS